eukprot:s1025_g6.t1
MQNGLPGAMSLSSWVRHTVARYSHTALAPRPKTIHPPHPDDRKRKRLPSPAGAPKAKAKSQPNPEPAKADSGSKYQDSWPRKTSDGRGICIRFNTGKCKSGKTSMFALFPILGANRVNAAIRHLSTGAHHTDLTLALRQSHRGALLQPIQVLIWIVLQRRLCSACCALNIDVFEPVDIIHGHDILDDDKFHSLLPLAESGLIGAALAAPYCCKHSRATLRRPGPRPVRPPQFLDGLPANSVEQQLAVQESSIVHDRVRLVLSAVGRSNGLVILENPASSMTWLDDLMSDWVHTIAPFAAHASACAFDTDWAKAWCFVANKPQIVGVAKSCTHGPQAHESVVGVRLPDGTIKSRLTAEYPKLLAAALADIIKPFTTCTGRVQAIKSWQNLLPAKLVWPTRDYRVEDAPPLSQHEREPYMHDLLAVLDTGDQFSHLLHITPGQPFRLRLWKTLVSTWRDPGSSFFDMLEEGVPLGVNQPLQPSPAWPINQSMLSLHELRSSYPRVAIVKLGIIIAEGRSPRLVVDSSVSNVTANTVLPNHMLLPRISDVMACAPDSMAIEEVVQLTLDVSKAHRRILIHPADQAFFLLCFHVGDDLYPSVTLNFGARASGYWGRVAGLMFRSAHALLDHHHIVWQYVGDLLSWLDKCTAPLWASALVILFLLLGIPVSL